MDSLWSIIKSLICLAIGGLLAAAFAYFVLDKVWLLNVGQQLTGTVVSSSYDRCGKRNRRICYDLSIIHNGKEYSPPADKLYRPGSRINFVIDPENDFLSRAGTFKSLKDELFSPIFAVYTLFLIGGSLFFIFNSYLHIRSIFESHKRSAKAVEAIRAKPIGTVYDLKPEKIDGKPAEANPNKNEKSTVPFACPRCKKENLVERESKNPLVKLYSCNSCGYGFGTANKSHINEMIKK